MRILIDLIHPANFHYFKHFINEMREKEHEIIVTARKKDVLQELLVTENIDYINAGTGKIGNGIIGKLLYFIYSEFFYLYILLTRRPEIVLSFSSSACAHNTFLLRIYHISFDDTEHAKLNRKLYSPFVDMILTPQCFYEKINHKQFKFNGFMELFYLNEKRFKPDNSILLSLKRTGKSKLVLFRFVSWEAFHDFGQDKLSNLEKIDLVKSLSEHADVIISSEGKVPIELEKFVIKIPVNKIHDLLSFIDLYVGEGGTMASECALLGKPSIYINSLPLMGYLKMEKDNGLIYDLKELEEIKKKSIEIINDDDLFDKYRIRKNKLLSGMIDPTSLLVWMIENYPASKIRLFEDPNYQNTFN